MPSPAAKKEALLKRRNLCISPEFFQIRYKFKWYSIILCNHTLPSLLWDMYMCMYTCTYACTWTKLATSHNTPASPPELESAHYSGTFCFTSYPGRRKSLYDDPPDPRTPPTVSTSVRTACHFYCTDIHTYMTYVHARLCISDFEFFVLLLHSGSVHVSLLFLFQK